MIYEMASFLFSNHLSFLYVHLAATFVVDNIKMAFSLFQFMVPSIIAANFIRLSSAGVLEKRQSQTQSCTDAECVLTEALLPPTFACTQT